MDDAAQLLALLKRAALEAGEAAKPVQLCTGCVTQTAPLRVLVEQRLALGERQLLVVRRLRAPGALAAGDGVLLARMQGGQQYALLDTI